MMEYWEKKFKDYFSIKENRVFSYRIWNDMVFGSVSQGEKRKILRDFNLYNNKFFELFDRIVEESEKKGYSAIIYPTIVSFSNAKNFFLNEEKNPTREEIFQFLYLVGTGVFSGGFVVNLLGGNQENWERFINTLKKDEAAILRGDQKTLNIKGLDLNYISSYLNVNVKIPWDKRHIFIFAFINFFVVWWLKEKEGRMIPRPSNISEFMAEKGIDNSATLVLFEFSKSEKNKVYFYPRINQFINKWYSEFLVSGKKEDIFLPQFLFSFLIFDKEFRDLSRNYLDQFLYFLLRGNVNGELLEKLVQLKVKSSIKNRKNNKKVYPVKFVDKFYAKLNK